MRACGNTNPARRNPHVTHEAQHQRGGPDGPLSARHRKAAIFGWLAFVVAAVVLGGALGTKQLTDNETLPGESGRAARMLDDGFEQPAGETVLVQSRKLTADSPAFRAAVADVVRRVTPVGVMTNVQSPYSGNRGQISANGHSGDRGPRHPGDADTATDRIQPVMDAVDAAAAANPSLRIEEFASSARSSSTRSSTRTSSGRVSSRCRSRS